MGGMGFGDLSQTALGWGQGLLTRAMIKKETDPLIRTLKSTQTPGQVANRNTVGRLGPGQIEGKPGFEDAVQSGFLTRSFDKNVEGSDVDPTTGETYHYNTYGVPEGRADDIVSGYFQRMQAEQAKADKMTAQRDQAEADLKTGVGEYDAAIAGLEADNLSNYTEQQAIYREGITNLQQQVTEFKATADQVRADLMSMRGEALAAAADRSAQVTESVTQGIQMQTQAQEAEIDADPNLTAGQKSAAKARLRFVNGSELRMAAAKSFNDEQMRLDAVRSEHDAQIAGALSSLGASEAGLRGNVSSAMANLNAGFASNINNYRANLATTKANLTQAKAAFRMAGRMDLFNMTAAIPEVYFDSGELSAMLLSEALMINQQDFDRTLETLNATLATEGLGLQAFQPAALQGQASDNARYNELEAIKAKKTSPFTQIASAVGQGAAGGIGQGFGSSVSGRLFGGGGGSPSVPNPIG